MSEDDKKRGSKGAAGWNIGCVRREPRERNLWL